MTIRFIPVFLVLLLAGFPAFRYEAPAEAQSLHAVSQRPDSMVYEEAIPILEYLEDEKLLPSESEETMPLENLRTERYSYVLSPEFLAALLSFLVVFLAVYIYFHYIRGSTHMRIDYGKVYSKSHKKTTAKPIPHHTAAPTPRKLEAIHVEEFHADGGEASSGGDIEIHDDGGSGKHPGEEADNVRVHHTLDPEKEIERLRDERLAHAARIERLMKRI